MSTQVDKGLVAAEVLMYHDSNEWLCIKKNSNRFVDYHNIFFAAQDTHGTWISLIERK